MQGLERDHREEGERRVVGLLEERWRAVRGKARFPMERDFDFLKLPGILDSCLFIEVRRAAKGRERYLYGWFGAEVWKIYSAADDVKGLCARGLRSDNEGVHRKLHQVVHLERPVHEAASFRNSANFMIKYRQCLLPVSKNSEDVDCIIGAITWSSTSMR